MQSLDQGLGYWLTQQGFLMHLASDVRLAIDKHRFVYGKRITTRLLSFQQAKHAQPLPALRRRLAEHGLANVSGECSPVGS